MSVSIACVSENTTDGNEIAFTTLGDDSVGFVLLRLRLRHLLDKFYELITMWSIEAVAFLDLPRLEEFHGLATREGVVRRGLKEVRNIDLLPSVPGDHLDVEVLLRGGRVVKTRHLGEANLFSYGVFLVQLVSDFHLADRSRFHGTVLAGRLQRDRGTGGVLIA